MHDAGSTAQPAPFSPEEQERLYAEDRTATRHVAGLLEGILLFGLLSYLALNVLIAPP